MKFTTTILTALLLCFVFVFGSNAQETNTNKSSEKQTEKKKGDKPLRIKRKPGAKSASGSCDLVSGRVSIKVTFDKSAKITKADILSSSGCNNFDQNALEAAYQIKFDPAFKNGEPVTVVKVVQYQFVIY